MCGMADKTADAYAVLGVSPNASSQQIRRAYKALCLRWHPDKHPPGSARRAAERQFKSISVAYTTVAERHSKRFTSANRHHSTATTSSSHSRNHFPSSAAAADFEDNAAFFFHDVCDSDDEDMHHYDGESSYRSTTRHQDFVLELPVTLPEYATGCVKQHRLPADDPDGTAKLLRVVVKPGYRPGDRIRFRHVRSDGGDVVFTLTQSTAAPWTDAKLLGDDVHITQRIQLVDALTGARISVCTPRGTRCMRVLPVIAPGATRVVPGCGLPCRGEPEQFGDVVVKFEVVFPSKVDDASKLKLRDVFSRMENSKMRRCSSVFSAKAFRRHEQQQKRTCSYCEREDYSEHTAHTDVPRGADMRGGVGSEDLKQHGAGSNERGGATQHQRLRTMFAKSSNKLASVFR